MCAWRPRYRDRLLAEAVRIAEEERLVIPGIDQAWEPAAHDGPDEPPEVRIVRRAAIAAPDEVRHGVTLARRVLGATTAILVTLGLVAGASAAAAALPPSHDRPVNVVRMLAAVLVAPTAMLALWVLMMAVARRGLAAGSLGAGAIAAARWIADRAVRDPLRRSGVHATLSVTARARETTWIAAAISHAAWLAFGVAAAALCLVALSTRQYGFAWETTILRDRDVALVLDAVAAGPRALGLDVPSPDALRAARLDPASAAFDQPDDQRRAWASLLVGSIAVYVALPRAALLALSVVAWRWRRARFRLDLGLPGYAALARASHRLGPPPAPEPESTPPRATPRPAPPTRPIGEPAIVGVELIAPAIGWPPPLGERAIDLGIVDAREERARAVESLRTAPTTPRTLIIVAPLATTPDRGLLAFVRDAREAAGSAASIVLTPADGAGGLDRDALKARRADWDALAEKAGVTTVVEIDLDHATEHARRRLASLAAGDAAEPTPPPRRLEAAFDLIARASERGPITGSGAVELHAAIARLHGVKSAQRALGIDLDPRAILSGGSEAARILREGAQRGLSLIPPSLRPNLRWTAAGALAGALGCVAAATLISPVAIGALPVWSAIGAAVAAVLPARRADEANEQSTDEPRRGLRAAALWAMVLELDGRDQADVRRILDEAIGDDRDADADALATAALDPAAARRWLDERRHRFDLAIAREQRP